ncbi:MAG: nitroreductase family protein [Lachnotalea sp.]
MEFLELAKKRFSVRKFKEDSIPQECIDKILEAGQVAPTACNNQPQRVLVINSKQGVENFKKCTKCHFNAPLVFIISYDKDQCWKRVYDGKSSGDIDASIVATHMMMEAAELGIGSTWVMFFIPEAIKVEFEFPNNLEPVAVLVMGYAANEIVPALEHTKIKNLDEIVSYNNL